jgi:hypothetical protein
MLHLDICGAAYDPKALVKTPDSAGTLVSPKSFVTPGYEMIPNIDGPLAHYLHTIN